jgi:hypothetical protein
VLEQTRHPGITHPLSARATETPRTGLQVAPPLAFHSSRERESREIEYPHLKK